MASENVYDICVPILQDDALEEEEKTDRLEQLVRKETDLTGKPLENAVLDVLWRFRNAGTVSSSSPPVRHTVLRRNSPAPWQVSRSGTPMGSSLRSAAASPAPPPGLGPRPSYFRMKSSNGSPFTSPRPSPRPSYATPHIPHSPNLNVYEFSEQGPTPNIYGGYSSDTVNWLVDDDLTSNTSSSYTGELGINGADWITPLMVEMSPYDILRSVLRDEKSDEEIEKVLEMNGYDLSAAIGSLMGGEDAEGSNSAFRLPEQDKTYLVGKSMRPGSRPVTPAGQSKSGVVCRYWLSTGQCLRADCRFSHDLSNHVCKYWLAGSCLAGDSCIFSHDPASLMNSLALHNNPTYMVSPAHEHTQPNLHLQDYDSFPSLRNVEQDRCSVGFESSLRNLYASQEKIAPPPGFSSRPALAPEFIPSQSPSRPISRHQSPGPRTSNLAMDDSEAFPTLGSAAVRVPKKHHGKRGHGHSHREKENGPNSLADVVRMSSSPLSSPRQILRPRSSYTSSRENSSAAQAIPAPEQIPWLETGARANKAYLKARLVAISHGSARNKFLQSAAQSWNRSDVRGAKVLSLRGQSENDLMREAHREAARALYDERNKHAATGGEVFVDLHGLHPAEAVSYLATALTNQRSTSLLHRDSSSVLYAIVGTGHHSKNGRDKVGKAIRAFLNECRYVFREFSVPGDRGGSGGILGIDAASGDISGGTARAESEASESSPAMQHGKIRILKAEDVGGGGL